MTCAQQSIYNYSVFFLLKCIVPFEGDEVKINMNITADDCSSKAQIKIFHSSPVR